MWHFLINFTRLYVLYRVNPVIPVLSCHLKIRPKMVFKNDCRLMQVKSIAEYSAILSTFIKLTFFFKRFVFNHLPLLCSPWLCRFPILAAFLTLSILEWPLKTCITFLSITCLINGKEMEAIN